MRNTCILLFTAFALLFTAGCTDEAKIEAVQKTVIPDCKGKTMQDLASGLLETPVWGIEKSSDGKQNITLSGAVAGGALPDWVKEQKLMNITFRFPLDPKTDEFNPESLGGFPSLTTPEGIFQAYTVFICE